MRHEPHAEDADSRPARLGPWLAALIAAAAMAVTQVGLPGLTGNDSYYHLRMAERLPEWGYVQSFPWLHWTILRDTFVSHHYGFHTLMAPLIELSQRLTGGPLWGAWAGLCLSMGATGALVYLLLAARGVAHPLWWVLLLGALPWHFWLRMAFWRAPMLGLPLMLLAVWCCLRHRPVLLGLTAFVFAHVYGGVVMLPLIPAAFLGAALFTGSEVRRPLVACLATGLGLAAGMVISPYFPANFSFLWVQLFETGLGGADDIGREWRPFDTWFFTSMSALLLGVWGAALIRRLGFAFRSDPHEIALLLLNLGFLVLTFKSRRFIEYWPVFALLNAADMGRWVFSRPRAAPDAAQNTAQSASTEPARGHLTAVALDAASDGWRITMAVLAAITIAAASLTTLVFTRLQLNLSHDHAHIAPAMAWLQENSRPGALVFADDWDVFPILFYYNQHNYYCTGLDPQFTATRWPAMWERYKRITRGEAPATVPRNLAERERLSDEQRRIRLTDVREWFGAEYVCVDDGHGPFYRQLLADARNFELVYPPGGEPERQPPIALFAVKPAAAGASRAAGADPPATRADLPAIGADLPASQPVEP